MSRIEGFVVVDSAGRLKRSQRGSTLYGGIGHAKAFANEEGDSVVAVSVNLDVPPVFIREKKL